MTEPSDLARLAAGVPVAILTPLCLPRLRASAISGPLLGLALAALVAIPLLPEVGAWMTLLAPPVFLLAVAPPRVRDRAPLEEPNTPSLRRGAAIVLPTAAITAACLLLLDPDATWDAISAAVSDNAAIVVAAGALAAIFAGGPLVAWVLSPFAQALTKDDSIEAIKSLAQAGTLIGWFERALFFAFIAGGEPQAAAVALAAKSFARFPSLSKHEEGFAEYFLIGTLASLVVALAAAIAVRATLGLSAF